MLEEHRTDANYFADYIEDEGYDEYAEYDEYGEYAYDYEEYANAMENILSYIEKPRKYETAHDFFLLEAWKEGELYAKILTLYEQGKLTATTRRKASIGAKDFIQGMCQKDIISLPRTPQTEGLVRVVLLGYASKINLEGLLSGDYPVILDKPQLVTACTHAGATMKAIYDLFSQWHPTASVSSHLTALTPSITHTDRKRALSGLYRAYRESPTTENAMKIVLYLMPIEAMRVCLITDSHPTIEQATVALSRAQHHGAGYERAVQQYIASVKKGS